VTYIPTEHTEVCDLATRAQLSSITGKPVGTGQGSDQISAGIVLPKVRIATCSWPIPAYPLLAFYVMREITPSVADARTEFNSQRIKMGIQSAPMRLRGYGDDAVFNIDSHADVTVIVLKAADVLTVEMNSPSAHVPSEDLRLTMAKAVAQLLVPQI
jgi:hypothetical protein